MKTKVVLAVLAALLVGATVVGLFRTAQTTHVGGNTWTSGTVALTEAAPITARVHNGAGFALVQIGRPVGASASISFIVRATDPRTYRFTIRGSLSARGRTYAYWASLEPR